MNAKKNKEQRLRSLKKSGNRRETYWTLVLNLFVST